MSGSSLNAVRILFYYYSLIYYSYYAPYVIFVMATIFDYTSMTYPKAGGAFGYVIYLQPINTLGVTII